MDFRSRVWGAAALGVALLAGSAWTPADAGPLFVPGSNFQVEGVNSPDTFSDTVPLTAGAYSLDGGRLDLTLSIVAGSANTEWLVFDYATFSGSALSQPSEDWTLGQFGLDAAAPVNLIATFVQWTDNGSVLAPTSSLPGFSIVDSPVPGGTGKGLANSSRTPYGPGPLPGLGISVEPFSRLAQLGIDPTQLTVNDYEQALEFAAQSVPEPGSLALLGTGLLAIGLIGFASRRKDSRVARSQRDANIRAVC